MIIRTRDGLRTAYAVVGAGRDHATYRCFPRQRALDENSRRRNKVEDEVQFRTVEEAAQYLINNPGTGVRMRPNSAIIYEHIIIDIDAD